MKKNNWNPTEGNWQQGCRGMPRLRIVTTGAPLVPDMGEATGLKHKI